MQIAILSEPILCFVSHVCKTCICFVRFAPCRIMQSETPHHITTQTSLKPASFLLRAASVFASGSSCTLFYFLFSFTLQNMFWPLSAQLCKCTSSIWRSYIGYTAPDSRRIVQAGDSFHRSRLCNHTGAMLPPRCARKMARTMFAKPALSSCQEPHVPRKKAPC